MLGVVLVIAVIVLLLCIALSITASRAKQNYLKANQLESSPSIDEMVWWPYRLSEINVLLSDIAIAAFFAICTVHCSLFDRRFLCLSCCLCCLENSQINPEDAASLMEVAVRTRLTIPLPPRKSHTSIIMPPCEDNCDVIR